MEQRLGDGHTGPDPRASKGVHAEPDESEEIVHAIRNGRVDAFVVGGQGDQRVYTLMGADHPYRMIVETMQEGAVVLTLEGTIVYCNASFANLLRTSIDDVVGSSLARFVATEDAGRFASLLAHGEPAQAELLLRTHRGPHIPVHVSRNSADLVGEDGVFLIVSDLSERRKQENLVASERLARSILEQAGEAIIVCDNTGRITHASRQAETLCDCSPIWAHFDEVLPLEAIDHSGSDSLHGRIDYASILGLTISGREVNLAHPDRQSSYLLLSSKPILDGEEKRIGTVIILTDITERKRIVMALRESEQNLKSANDALEERVRERTAELQRANRILGQKNRELEDFNILASHDLQEPLRKIRAFCDLLMLELHDDLSERGMSYVQRIQRSAARMSDLFRDLLSFSQVSSKDVEVSPVNLDETLARIRNHYRSQIEELGATLEFDSFPTIEADPEQIEQLLAHLVENALKFHREGVPPTIRISCTLEEGSDGQADGRQCRLEVEDNGIGFEMKYVDRIFAPSQRLYDRELYSGTGMGLAICRRIAERHGGSITAESRPGEGTRFIVSIPLRSDGVDG